MNARSLRPRPPIRWRWLLEMILVLDLIVIGPLALAGLEFWHEGKIAAASNIHDYFGSEMDIALNAYKTNTGSYPTTKQGLQALITPPGGVTNWRGPYLTTMPLDPWGHPYRYAYPSVHGQAVGKYDCWSLGPDGKDGTAAAIGNWLD